MGSVIGLGLGVGEPDGTEHSFTPPDTLLPAPKVASEHTKLPLNVLKVNRSARPKATLVDADTEQVLFSLQIVVYPLGRLAACAASAAAMTPSAKIRSRDFIAFPPCV